VATRSLGTLTLDLIAKIGGFARGMDEAERKADRTARAIAAKHKARAAEVQAAWGNATKFIGGAIAGIGVSGVISFSRQLVDGIDALNDFADATGASVESASALEDIARRTGTTLEGVEGILVRFNAALKDAKPDSDTGRVLKQLGLDAEALKRVDPAEALRQVAVALSGYADDGNKARIVQELFGKSVREAAPFLKDLAEAGQLNATVTRQQAEEAERLNKMIFGLQKDFTDLARSIGADLIPQISQLLTLFKNLREGPGLFAAFKQSLVRSFDTPTDGLSFYNKELQKLDKELERFQKRAGSNQFSVAESSRREIDKLKAQREELVKFANAYRNTVNAAGAGAGGGRGFVNPGAVERPGLRAPNPPPRAGGIGRAKQEIDEVAKALDELERELALFGQDADFEKAFKFEALGATTAQLETYRAKLAELKNLRNDEEITKTIEALEKQHDQLQLTTTQIALNELAAKGASQGQIDYAKGILEATEAQRKQNELIEEGKRLNEQFRTPLEVLLDRYKQLNEQLSINGITQDTYRRAVEDAQKTFEDATKPIETAIKDTNNVAKELGMTFSSAFEDAIVNGGKLKDVLRGLEQDILRIITRKLVTEPLANFVTNAIGGLFGGFRAAGGGVNTGRAYVVGEEGPELFVPRASGTIVPADRTAAMSSGGMSIVNHFAITGPVDRRTQEQISNAVARGAQRVGYRGGV
jgi:hypothetical protein